MHSLLVDVQRRAAQAGLNLFSPVDTARFDACQSSERRLDRRMLGCGTALVFGSGGREFWRRMAAANGSPGAPSPRHHPVGDYADACLGEIATVLAANDIEVRAVTPRRDRAIGYLQLAEAAGFGTVSPVIGALLHPHFGPWVSVHGALLVAGAPFGPVGDASLVERFQPCCGCHRPCLSACPVGTHDGEGNRELHRCATHRHADNCNDECRVRRACPVGAEHRFDPGQEAHVQAHRLFGMQKVFGLGVWRLVPRILRH